MSTSSKRSRPLSLDGEDAEASRRTRRSTSSCHDRSASSPRISDDVPLDWGRGLAKVAISSLSFTDEAQRPLDPANVDRLRAIYKRVGCGRLEEAYAICAVVEPSQLEQALLDSGVDQSRLRTNSEPVPLLRFGSLTCLHGRHRIAAAREFLPVSEQQWIIRLFPADLPKEARRRLVEYYDNAQPFSDGEIFWKIRHYHKSGNTGAEDEWWARLSNTKRMGLRQLLSIKGMVEAFDDLLQMPGLWRGIKLGTLQRLHRLKCEEELLHYLRHVKTVWTTVMASVSALDLVDDQTVECLQLLTPGVAFEDEKTVEALLASKKAFPKLANFEKRQLLRANLSRITCLIPSLWTFFENLKCIEPCCEVLRDLFGVDSRGAATIRAAAQKCYVTPSQPIVECADGSQEHYPIGEDDWATAYKQIWLFCMRNFEELTAFRARKEVKSATVKAGKENPFIRQALGTFAMQLGFCSSRAQELASQDPYRALAQRGLENLGTRGLEPRGSIEKIAAEFKKAHRGSERAQDDRGVTAMTKDVPGEPLERRCGRPFVNDLELDRRSLFYDVLRREVKRGHSITSLFVRRDIVEAFLGEIAKKSAETDSAHAAHTSVYLFNTEQLRYSTLNPYADDSARSMILQPGITLAITSPPRTPPPLSASASAPSVGETEGVPLPSPPTESHHRISGGIEVPEAAQDAVEIYELQWILSSTETQHFTCNRGNKAEQEVKAEYEDRTREKHVDFVEAYHVVQDHVLWQKCAADDFHMIWEHLVRFGKLRVHLRRNDSKRKGHLPGSREGLP